MAKSKETFNKKEKEKKRRKKKQQKLERRELRKAEKAESGAKSFDDMIAYVDENGNFSTTPPDPKKKQKIKVEDIIIGAAPLHEAPGDGVHKGRVKFFNEEKGYGFIINVDTQDSIFVHINNLSGPLRENDRVTFEVEMGPKGPNAVNVKLV